MNKAELLKVAKPILFNTEMVMAVLEDRKTVTRRAIKVDLNWADTDENDSSYLFFEDKYGDSYHAKYFCRYQVGDILYVRETYRDVIVGLVGFEGEAMWTDDVIEYKASQKEFEEKYEGLIGEHSNWYPSIHMPKEAARIFLKVTGVRVERLHEINEEDYVKEGITDNFIEHIYTSVMDFMILWDSTIKKQDLDKYGWKANPYVWVIEFERLKVD